MHVCVCVCVWGQSFFLYFKKCIKVYNRDFHIVKKSFLMLLFWTFYLSKNPESLIIMRNVSWAANQHFRMIYEGSCDPEDKSSNAEN